VRARGQAPVDLGGAITGIDERNPGILIRSVVHASGPASSRSYLKELAAT